MAMSQTMVPMLLPTMMRHASRSAEMVTDGHPDKFCDQVADRILDAALEQDPDSRVAVECLAKDNLIMVSGEVTTKASLDIEVLAREVWEKTIGYGPGDELVVINHLKRQSLDITRGAGKEGDGGVDFGGAGDQGVMIGYATTETPEMMPLEYILARQACQALHRLRRDGELSWLRPDGKSQVSLVRGVVTSLVIAAHHDSTVSTEQVRQALTRLLVMPIFGSVARVVINGTGSFMIGGPRADAGVVGRKIVVDAYGPRVPVGGGAYSGKDPSKVDRSAAYMARHIAKTIVAHRVEGAQECLVGLAFGIGQHQPEMISATTGDGRDLSAWVCGQWPDLSPSAITEYLGLRRPKGWSYTATAAFGHYGRNGFPWEQVASIK